MSLIVIRYDAMDWFNQNRNMNQSQSLCEHSNGTSVFIHFPVGSKLEHRATFGVS
jgi:hypothetical protein